MLERVNCDTASRHFATSSSSVAVAPLEILRKFGEKEHKFAKSREFTRWVVLKAGRKGGRHGTHVEKLYRSNEAIKRGRGHIITAYKGARKILPIPGGGIAHAEDDKVDREGEKAIMRRSEVPSRFSCPAHPEIDSRPLFLFHSRPKYDRLNPGADGVSSSRHEKILGLFHRELAECFVIHEQYCKRDLIRSKLAPKIICPRNLRLIKIWGLH